MEDKTGLTDLPVQRYIVTPLENGDYVIADTQDMGTPRLYMLNILPRLGDLQANWTILLGSFNPLHFRDEDGPPIQIETLIWECTAYLRKPAAAISMGKQILISLDQEEIDIDNPYELAFKFGGQVLTH